MRSPWLQKQTHLSDFAKANGKPYHRATKRDCHSSLLHKSYDSEIIIDLDDIIARGGAYMATASLMLKKQVIVNMPAWFMNAPGGGDYFYITVSALENKKYDFLR
ncbi:hypothetical protein NX722_01760 [Endozoicomonas gorgoniicola]|uniref:Uncharacterized protein n=1 Tax=Endozoicomonas gorgoniicola TaxID=1234144 RepID=A0ABT3MPU1_9GAMM|nr:hypothetical protein [Endozoicomonas gorgoniicola]MCW7551385.1 hypothetical protein [Endozoicomonas gorgoniicola]